MTQEALAADAREPVFSEFGPLAHDRFDQVKQSHNPSADDHPEQSLRNVRIRSGKGGHGLLNAAENGQPTMWDGKETGDLPGKVLRSGSYR